uniref:Uncharacterized protein n=1 Tax=Trichogramma kaykai TaxID=54128 RepID=A0ABD2XDH1_9HYME
MPRGAIVKRRKICFLINQLHYRILFGMRETETKRTSKSVPQAKESNYKLSRKEDIFKRELIFDACCCRLIISFRVVFHLLSIDAQCRFLLTLFVESEACRCMRRAARTEQRASASHVCAPSHILLGGAFAKFRREYIIM